MNKILVSVIINSRPRYQNNNLIFMNGLKNNNNCCGKFKHSPDLQAEFC